MCVVSRAPYAALAIHSFGPTAVDAPALTLKQAHQRLKPTSARVQLVPGEPASALARVANSLAQVELVIFSASEPLDEHSDFWFYLPRTLSQNARLFVEVLDPKTGRFALAPLDRATIEARAAKASARRRQAA